MSTRPTVVVVGAGFSGLLTTLHLLSAPDGPTVRLLERRGSFGRGRAYETTNPDHLLNVRVANMSAFADQPDHFTQWLARHGGWRGTNAFVTRGVYGEYLQSLLAAAVKGAYGVDRLLLEFDEAVDLKPAHGRWRVETAMGRAIAADAVVLALGALPPSPPHGASPELLASSRYVADPWAADFSRDLGRRVLLLGTGLTMVDVAFAFSRPHRRFTAISRRGLLPHAHDTRPPAPGRAELSGTPLEVLRQVRSLARTRDWRAVVDEARGSVRDLWAAWPLAERRRFLRHLRPWWDIHRHRMAPPVARRLAEMREAGDLTVRAGSILSLDLHEDEVRVVWRARHTRSPQLLRVDAVVNCTGHAGEIRLAGQPLIEALLAQGVIRPDHASLGLDVDARSRPRDTSGEAVRGLYAVGPLTRGSSWEITSVPDIRRQAMDVAREIVFALASRPAHSPSAE